MPISRVNIERVAHAFKILQVRRAGGPEAYSIAAMRPTEREMLQSATWAAMFELAETNHDAHSLADMLERILVTGKPP